MKKTKISIETPAYLLDCDEEMNVTVTAEMSVNRDYNPHSNDPGAEDQPFSYQNMKITDNAGTEYEMEDFEDFTREAIYEALHEMYAEYIDDFYQDFLPE